MDDASEWTIPWRLVVPMNLPAVLPVGLLYFIAVAEQLPGGSIGQTPWHLVMMLATVMVAPVIVLFGFVQGRFVEGVKGCARTSSQRQSLCVNVPPRICLTCRQLEWRRSRPESGGLLCVAKSSMSGSPQSEPLRSQNGWDHAVAPSFR